MSARDKRGFTLVELIVVAVLGTVILLAGYSTLITNRRAYTVQRARVQGQQTLRTSADVLMGELREISLDGGDLLNIGDDFVELRAVRGFGFVCKVDYSQTPPLFRTRLLHGVISATDSAVVFAENDPELEDDDAWLSGHVTSAGPSGTSCPSGDPAWRVYVDDLGTTDSVRVGAQIRGFQRFKYGLRALDRESYLSRERPDGTVEPVVGPLGDPSRQGLEFEYFDETGAPVAAPADVEWIRVILRTPLYPVGGGRTISDSLVVQVHPRN